MTVLSLSHTADDITQSFLPAVLPALVASLHLSYTAAATLVLSQAISSSVVQPAIGYLADRKPLPWLSAVGVLLAGFGIAAIGFAPSYAWMVVAALVSGLGVAAFHPEAARFANYVAGSKKATGMRWFSLGGNLGFAIGPILAALSLAAFGIRGTLAAALPVTLAGIALFIELPRLRGFIPAKTAKGERVERDDWSSFSKLTVFVTLRSTAYIGLVAFTPLFFVHALHASQMVGNIALSAYLIAGMAGTIVGGPIADRVSRRAVLLTSTAAAALLIAIYAAIAWPATVGLAIAAIALVGFVLTASQTAFVVLGQEYLPQHIGVASGITLGLAVSLGGVLSPALGAIGDRYGLHATIFTCAGLAALAFASALFLPNRQARSAYRRATPAAVAE